MSLALIQSESFAENLPVMSLLFYNLFHKSDKSETRFLRPAPTERCHKGWRCLHIWLLRGSNANKQKDQSAEFIIDHPELMSIRCLPEFALKRIKETNQGIVCSITAAVKYEGPEISFLVRLYHLWCCRRL
ncbi:hypothetical protein SAMN05216315_10738 [Nitrosospira sp. Nsp18]|uniref:hypothetical protein n=1 Tax=Nitrosospira sp. Nsp18 TaxID=1855334 RepID=UPI00088B37AF|nr:hypothetical protein [Nitrosospira sp. Nsp18]SDA16168.1 hypothetical protein SAMN05216315_10738 [Nitrosospira sp. Nsp18]